MTARAKNSEIAVERKRRVKAMFNAIAGRYDLLNHLLSAGVDLYWRRRALSLVRRPGPSRVLDLATGTGDFALASRRLQPRRVIGVDVALAMLRIGVRKVADQDDTARDDTSQVRLMAGDAEQLPFRDGCFDLVTAAFGVRNFGDIPTGLSEAWRVLGSGGELLILDFTEPTLPGFKQVYRFYFRFILPFVGGIVSGQRKAYSYLPQSVGNFPQGAAFLELMADAGFEMTRAMRLTLGICAVYQGCKPQGNVLSDK